MCDCYILFSVQMNIPLLGAGKGPPLLGQAMEMLDALPQAAFIMAEDGMGVESWLVNISPLTGPAITLR